MPDLLQSLVQFPLVWAAVSACIGSFLTVLVYRFPLIENSRELGLRPSISLSNPPSSCACCGTRIKWKHNLPILGYLLLRGRTHCCKKSYSPRYVSLEVAALAWGMAVWWTSNEHPAFTVWASSAGWLCIAAALLLSRSSVLPVPLSALAFGLSVLYQAIPLPSLQGSLAIATAVFGIAAFCKLSSYASLKGIWARPMQVGAAFCVAYLWMPLALWLSTFAAAVVLWECAHDFLHKKQQRQYLD
ncbi:prepilin peptidase [Nostoc sp. CHAB 5834]|nr:prepilin peptidase [Nostoc sp. CHAB 5834]